MKTLQAIQRLSCAACCAALASAAPAAENALSILRNGEETILSDENTLSLGRSDETSGNLLTVEISGDRNGGWDQGWGQETGLWSALDRPGRIVQDGSGNQAAIDVAGSGNLFSVTQSGDANRARLVVEGTANLAAIAQSGQGHLAVVRQTGTGNMVAISQSSW